MPIGTAAAIAISAMAGAEAGASIYGAKKSGDINRRSIEADVQMRESEIRAQQQEEAFAREEAASERAWRAEQAQFGRDENALVRAAREGRWDDYVDLYRQSQQFNNQIYGSVAGLLGVDSGGAPPPGAGFSPPPPQIAGSVPSGGPPGLPPGPADPRMNGVPANAGAEFLSPRQRRPMMGVPGGGGGGITSLMDLYRMAGMFGGGPLPSTANGTLAGYVGG